MKSLLTQLCLIGCLGMGFLEARPAQVIIIRHGEKQKDGELSQAGQERAGALGTYLTQNSALLNFGQASAIFAARPVHFLDDNTLRCIQSVTPAASLLSLPVHSQFGSEQEEELVHFILHDHRYDGKNVIICWHHHSILDLVRLFGYTSPIASIPSDRYDLTFIMTFPITNPVATVLLQELMFNDPTTLPP